MSAAGQLQRVQLVVRGRRFESNVEILSAYCLLFRSFFHEAFAKITTSNDVKGENDDWWVCYEVARRTLLVYLQRPIHDDMVVDVTSIELDLKASMWRFVYTAETLAPEDVGVVFVYIRKLFRWNQQQQKQLQEGQTEWKQEPQLPIRWEEMPCDAQLAMARVVCTFGVEPLVGRFDRPTAPHSNNGKSTEADPVSLREKAEVYARQRLQQERSVACGAEKEEPTEATLEKGRDRFQYAIADEDLVLETTACSRCGITGHADANCPH
ncbi:hypothetical protein MOQ_005543 [Trypanosoma cruzi marinkellei]|uniref:CCHC-type domain-containing protein n=1 Tax=Trypanosoma cruzi marinkellei TaxID=85056 RepID=K2MUD2_TRYCR|nr:hypothetical protein MOQ_005543 [Trypanosoma cruzi marinkellei]